MSSCPYSQHCRKCKTHIVHWNNDIVFLAIRFWLYYFRKSKAISAQYLMFTCGYACMCALGCVLRACARLGVSCELWAVSCELWAVSCELWAVSCELWAVSCVLCAAHAHKRAQTRAQTRARTNTRTHKHAHAQTRARTNTRTHKHAHAQTTLPVCTGTIRFVCRKYGMHI